jgi:lipase chaperone LimK
VNVRRWGILVCVLIALAASTGTGTGTSAPARVEPQPDVPLTEAEADTIRPVAAVKVEAALRAMGTTAEEIRAWRAATFGAAAAARLDQVDRRRADFARRLARLRAGERVDGRFAPEERARVDALERLRADASR